MLGNYILLILNQEIFINLNYIQVANKSTTALSPSIVETYSRLLVYSEIESLGIKGTGSIVNC